MCYYTNNKKQRTNNGGDQGFKTKVTEDVVSEIMLEFEDEAPVAVEFFGQKLIIQKNALIYKEEETQLPESFREIHILIDREILEVFGNEGTLNAYYETGSDILQGEISVSGGNGSGKLFEWRR